MARGERPINRRDWAYLDYIHQFVFVLEADEDGVPRYAAFNRYACDISGWGPQDVIGKSALDLYPGRLGEVAYARHAGTFRDGNQSTFEVLLPFGSERCFLRTTLTPELRDDGSVRRVFGTSVDILGDEAPVSVRRGVASESDEMEDFIKLAAHDLRSPIRNVKVIADMLREDFIDMGDGKVELLDMLGKIGDKAMSLLDDVVTYAQSSVPGHAVEIDFEFHDLVRDIMDVLDPFGHARVTTDQALIRGERNVMQMILRNLIDNSIKHAELRDGGSELVLTIAVEADGLDRIGVTVEDDGGGFKDTALLFLNGGKLKTGSGFGLFGVRRLVRARGGSLSAATLPGGRARVYFSLPGTLVSGGQPGLSQRQVRGRQRA